MYFFIAGVSITAIFPSVKNMSNGSVLPEHLWHSGISFLFPNEKLIVHFPSVPFVAFTMFGAMIGALLHDFHGHIKKFYFPLIFMAVGISLYFFSPEILGSLDNALKSLFGITSFKTIDLRRMYEKVGLVLIVISILISIDNTWGNKIKDNSLFLKIGQNTLTIYIARMLLLYVLVHALGLKDDINHTFSPWASGIGAVLFIVLFVFMIKYLEEIKALLNKVLEWIKIRLPSSLNKLRSKNE